MAMIRSRSRLPNGGGRLGAKFGRDTTHEPIVEDDRHVEVDSVVAGRLAGLVPG
jgi:hypothetical protein